jgi:hypothetical protein
VNRAIRSHDENGSIVPWGHLRQGLEQGVAPLARESAGLQGRDLDREGAETGHSDHALISPAIEVGPFGTEPSRRRRRLGQFQPAHFVLGSLVQG